ncbi:MAG: VCBS repeat-containing protein [Chitinophagaceae bacterium]
MMNGFLQWLLVLSIIVTISCNQPKPKPLFELVNDSGINFENNVEDGKLENSFLFRNFYNGGGVAIADINNDGLPDVFLTSNTGTNKLYLNKGHLQFEDVSVKAGILPDDKWYTGACFADINNDGWLDLYVCSSGHMGTNNRKNKLYINNQHGGFTEEAARYGLAISAYTTQVSFFDYDMDGDLDCFMINNSPVPVNQLNFSYSRDLPEKDWPVGAFLKGGGDHLYRNDEGNFKEVTREAGIHGGLISFGLGVSVGDINLDGYPDVFVSNDSYERDYIYINQKNGVFKDEAEQYLQHTSMSSMGSDLADINNDGYPDIFTTDMLPDDDYRLKTTGSFDNFDLYRSKEKSGLYRQFVKNCLQLNARNGKFMEIANYSGVSASDWSWGALFFDADNDGFNDIYVCNGVNRDVIDLDFMDFFANDVVQKMVLTHKKENIDEVLKKIPRNPLLNKVFRNKGNLQFEDIGKTWGFTQPTFSNGAAYADLDNDGDLDLIVNNENQPSFLYRNNAREKDSANNYISILLQGKGKNSFSIGAKIHVYAADKMFYREVVPSRGFQSSVEYKQTIGLGKIIRVDSVIITWADNTTQKINNPAVNQLHAIQQAAGIAANAAAALLAPSAQPMLLPLANTFDKHAEDDYIDFYYERNMPEMLSREGPKAAYGDINADGLADIYIGGTPGHEGQVYMQTAQGKFEKKMQPAFTQFTAFEDGAVLFFDADHDGDLDLFIGPGGNSNDAMSREMQNRLFKNDGRGNFTLDVTAFPASGMNTGVAVAYDFNHDGYEDLFVGGRSVSRQYGINPASFLYMNDGNGHFTDIAGSNNPAIAAIGMVTGAAWVDISGDKNKELVIAGEWMSPRVFSYNGHLFQEINTNLSNLYGWWQTLTVADMDGDGREDLILGNIGENFYLRPDEQHPVKLWMNDFDQNGSTDLVLSRTINGKDMPVFMKHDVEDLLPSLKKKNLRHHVFAEKTIQELFPPEQVRQTKIKQFNYAPSCIAYNEGQGKFTVQNMDAMVQLSSVNAVSCLDMNGDGIKDLVIGGNKFWFPTQFGRLDASLGSILINNGKRSFTWLYPNQSGLNITGEVKDIVAIKSVGKSQLLFLMNDAFPVLYEVSANKSEKIQ